MERIRLLIVDDELEFRTLLEAYFASRTEFEVVGLAEDGVRALELATLHKPDLLLCDINMPRMNGIQVTKQLTASMPEIQIVILSGNDYGEFSKKALEA